MQVLFTSEMLMEVMIRSVAARTVDGSGCGGVTLSSFGLFDKKHVKNLRHHHRLHHQSSEFF